MNHDERLREIETRFMADQDDWQDIRWLIERVKTLAASLGTISRWDFAADGRKFNGNHKAVVKEITGIARSALWEDSDESINLNQGDPK